MAEEFEFGWLVLWAVLVTGAAVVVGVVLEPRTGRGAAFGLATVLAFLTVLLAAQEIVTWMES